MKRLLICLFLVLPLLAQTPVSNPYDPLRDPAKDLSKAMAEAHATGRNILLDVGGNWCGWCHHLDKFFVDHPELRELRDKNYVLVYVNFSRENENRPFLKQFPAIKGFPHLFVLNADGKLIRSEDTGPLEDGHSSYVPERVREFLTIYGPQKQAAAGQ